MCLKHFLKNFSPINKRTTEQNSSLDRKCRQIKSVLGFRIGFQISERHIRHIIISMEIC